MIRRDRAEAAIAAAITPAELNNARMSLVDLDAAESDRLTWELLLALQPFTVTNHRWSFRDAWRRRSVLFCDHLGQSLDTPTAGGWIADRRDRRHAQHRQPPATLRRWRE